MSKMLELPTYTKGLPGAASCKATSPLRISALVWTIVPASVTGAVAPARARL